MGASGSGVGEWRERGEVRDLLLQRGSESDGVIRGWCGCNEGSGVGVWRARGMEREGK